MKLIWNDAVIESRDSDNFINATQMCKACKKRMSNWLRLDCTKEMINYLKDTISTPIIKAVGGNHSGTWIHPRLATVLAQWLDPMFGLKVAEWIEEWRLIGDNDKRYMYAISNLQPTEAEQLERQVKERLHAKLGGIVEQKTPAGRIDLLTDQDIIEIKEISKWKHALGQVLAYSIDYPEKRKRIHLFGDSNSINKSMIVKRCNIFDIIVSFEM